MKVRSGHIRFDRSVTWRKLLPAFRPMLMRFFEESGQMPEDPEVLEVLVEENLRELRQNRKPEGYNRENAIRMVFPISDDNEFYIYSKLRQGDVPRVVDAVSHVLQKYKLKHTIDWDRLRVFAEKK